jgi:hypothetical protein
METHCQLEHGWIAVLGSMHDGSDSLHIERASCTLAGVELTSAIVGVKPRPDAESGTIEVDGWWEAMTD